MTVPPPSTQTLREQVRHCYEALRWGGIEAEVRVAQLAETLRRLEQHPGRQRLAQRVVTERPLLQKSQESASSRLLACAYQVLRIAQELGVLPVSPVAHSWEKKEEGAWRARKQKEEMRQVPTNVVFPHFTEQAIV